MTPFTARDIAFSTIYIPNSKLIDKGYQRIGAMCRLVTVIKGTFGRNQILIVHYRE